MKINKYKLSITEVQKNALHDIFRKSHFSDVTVHCGNHIFRCHRVILAMQSPFFYSMFTSGMKECVTGKVSLDAENPDSLIRILNFMYGEQLDITNETEALLGAAEFLQVESVSHVCCSYLLDTLNPSNLVSLWDLLERYGKADAINRLVDQVAAQFKMYSKILQFSTISFDRALQIAKSPEFIFESDITLSIALQWSTVHMMNREELLWKLVNYLTIAPESNITQNEDNSSTLLALASIKLASRFWSLCMVIVLLEEIERSKSLFRCYSSISFNNADIENILICQCNSKNSVIFIYKIETVIYNLVASRRTSRLNNPPIRYGEKMVATLCENYLYMFNGHNVHRTLIDHYKCEWKARASVPNHIEAFVPFCDKRKLFLIDCRFTIYKYDEAFDEWKQFKSVIPENLQTYETVGKPIYHSQSAVGHLIVYSINNSLVAQRFIAFPSEFTTFTLPVIRDRNIKHMEIIEISSENYEIFVQDDSGEFWEFDRSSEKWMNKDTRPMFNAERLNDLILE